MPVLVHRKRSPASPSPVQSGASVLYPFYCQFCDGSDPFGGYLSRRAPSGITRVAKGQPLANKAEDFSLFARTGRHLILDPRIDRTT